MAVKTCPGMWALVTWPAAASLFTGRPAGAWAAACPPWQGGSCLGLITSRGHWGAAPVHPLSGRLGQERNERAVCLQTQSLSNDASRGRMMNSFVGVGSPRDRREDRVGADLWLGASRALLGAGPWREDGGGGAEEKGRQGG